MGRVTQSGTTLIEVLVTVVIIAMGLHFLGVFRMFWVSRVVRYQHKEHPGGLAGAYLIGLAFAFGWTVTGIHPPCLPVTAVRAAGDFAV